MSIRIPFPAGNWREFILPTLRDQSFETSSAVTRSWREYIGGGVSGFSGKVEIGREDRRWPCARRS